MGLSLQEKLGSKVIEKSRAFKIKYKYKTTWCTKIRWLWTATSDFIWIKCSLGYSWDLFIEDIIQKSDLILCLWNHFMFMKPPGWLQAKLTPVFLRLWKIPSSFLSAEFEIRFKVWVTECHIVALLQAAKFQFRVSEIGRASCRERV